MPITIAEIAAEIDAHLKQFGEVMALTNPAAREHKRKVHIRYNWLQGVTLAKADALAYLAWLDAGNIGRHLDMPKKETL